VYKNASYTFIRPTLIRRRRLETSSGIYYPSSGTRRSVRTTERPITLAPFRRNKTRRRGAGYGGKLAGNKGTFKRSSAGEKQNGTKRTPGTRSRIHIRIYPFWRLSPRRLIRRKPAHTWATDRSAECIICWSPRIRTVFTNRVCSSFSEILSVLRPRHETAQRETGRAPSNTSDFVIKYPREMLVKRLRRCRLRD